MGGCGGYVPVIEVALASGYGRLVRRRRRRRRRRLALGLDVRIPKVIEGVAPYEYDGTIREKEGEEDENGTEEEEERRQRHR